MSLTKSILLWMLAFVLMGATAVYQRMTGPTYPVSGKVEIQREKVKYSLPRSHDGSGNDLIKLEVKDQTIYGYMKFKRYKSHDEWAVQQLKREGNYLYASIPEQPPAGKVMYHIALLNQEGKNFWLTKEPVVIRFKGVVPQSVLVPHIIAMFFAMVFSIRAGIESIVNGNKTFTLSLWTLILLTVGGLILGPIVQNYAFGAFWTGWPFGHDLTDNKTLAAFIAWAIAVWRLKKNPGDRKWAIIAMIVLLAVYLIPHSVLGSEIDYTKTN